MGKFVEESFAQMFNIEAQRLIESHNLVELEKRKKELWMNYNKYDVMEIFYRAFLILFEEKLKLKKGIEEDER